MALLQSAPYTNHLMVTGTNTTKQFQVFEMIMNYNDNKLYVKFGLIF